MTDNPEFVLPVRCRDRNGMVAGDAGPVAPGNTPQRKAARSAMIDDQRVELMVLARYMHAYMQGYKQVLADATSRKLEGRVINIHHSSLPAFKASRPCHRAWDRRVRLVGATGHHVTPDLDDGSIIAKGVSVVDLADTIDELIAQGRETDGRLLTRAVNAHCARRVRVNGARAVVFK